MAALQPDVIASVSAPSYNDELNAAKIANRNLQECVDKLQTMVRRYFKIDSKFCRKSLFMVAMRFGLAKWVEIFVLSDLFCVPTKFMIFFVFIYS